MSTANEEPLAYASAPCLCWARGRCYACAVVESFFVQLVVRCEECAQPLPVGAMRPETTCSQCDASRKTDLELWRFFIDPGMVAEMLVMSPEQVERDPQLRSGGSVTYGKRTPRCSNGRCDAPLPHELLREEALAQHRLGCPTCGTVIGVRPADDFVREFLPGARWVVGESVAVRCTWSAGLPQHLNCSACGASLPAAGDAGSVVCSYCNATNLMPARGRPVHRSRGFFILADIDASLRREILWAHERGQPWVAADRQLPSEWAWRLLEAPNPYVRAVLAQNPSVGADVLERLVDDPDSDVREAIVGNPAVPPQVLTRLMRDRDTRVREAVARAPGLCADLLCALAELGCRFVARALVERDDLPEPALMSLTRSESEDVRLAVAKHPRAPLAALRRLASWNEINLVANPARWRLAELGRQGVRGVGFWGSSVGRVFVRPA
jgi:hypothetical protein